MRTFKTLRNNQNGFTFIELMIVLAIIGIILLIIGAVIFGISKAVPYAKSQTVSDIAAIDYVEAQDAYSNVKLLETHRINPEKDIGCTSTDDAGFKMRVNGDEIIFVCCLGSAGHTPRCEIVSEPPRY